MLTFKKNYVRRGVVIMKNQKKKKRKINEGYLSTGILFIDLVLIKISSNKIYF